MAAGSLDSAEDPPSFHGFARQSSATRPPLSPAKATMPCVPPNTADR
jgi:hypothetical protein